jgi:dolichyl-phosphate-mannose--protein O-mannosyl transferase
MSDWTPALWWYALSTVCVFVVFALLASEVRESVWDDEDEDEARCLARLAFAAPFWPLLLAFVVVRGLIRLARLALGGAR